MESFDLTADQLKRINVVGTSGIGKTTFGRQLAATLDCPHIELDRLYWGPNWTEVDPDLFQERLETATKPERWVLDGNYSKITEFKQKKLTAMVWLDYRFGRNFRQAVSRAFNRAWTKKELWPGTGNRESFRKLFFSHDSIVLWTIQTYRTNRRRYLKMMKAPEWSHVKIVQLRSPEAAQSFLERVSQVDRCEQAES